MGHLPQPQVGSVGGKLGGKLYVDLSSDVRASRALEMPHASEAFMQERTENSSGDPGTKRHWFAASIPMLQVCVVSYQESQPLRSELA